MSHDIPFGFVSAYYHIQTCRIIIVVVVIETFTRDRRTTAWKFGRVKVWTRFLEPFETYTYARVRLPVYIRVYRRRPSVSVASLLDRSENVPRLVVKLRFGSGQFRLPRRELPSTNFKMSNSKFCTRSPGDSDAITAHRSRLNRMIRLKFKTLQFSIIFAAA